MGFQIQLWPSGTFQKFTPFAKVDVIQHTVSGIFTAERPDRSGEICDYASTKPQYEKWSQTQAAATGGKSFGNVREMHGLTAVGKVTQILYDDAAKTISGTVKIVEDSTWNKILEGVLTGFSQGGSYLGGLRTEKSAEGGTQKRYTAQPTEMSVVDLPCLPDATFELIKADGSVEVKKFSHISKQEEVIDMQLTKEELETLVKTTVASSMQEILEKGGSGSGKKPFTEQQGSPDKAVQDSEQILFHPQTGLCPKCNKGAGECKCTMKATTNDSEQILLNPSLTQQEKAVGGICPKCQKETEKCECAAKVAAGPCPKCGLAKEKCACAVMPGKKKPSAEKMAHAVTVVYAKALEKFYSLTPEKVEKVLEGSMKISEELSKGGPGSGRRPYGLTDAERSVTPEEHEAAAAYHQNAASMFGSMPKGALGGKAQSFVDFHSNAAQGHSEAAEALKSGKSSEFGDPIDLSAQARQASSYVAAEHKISGLDPPCGHAKLKTTGRVDRAATPSFYKVFSEDEVEQAPVPLKKGMNAVSRLAQFLLDIAWLKWSVEQEEAAEGDENSPLPAKLQEDLAAMAETLMEMAGEETKELVTMLAEGKSPYETGLTPQGSPSFCGPLTTSCPVPFFRAMENDDLQKADFDPTLGFGGTAESQPPFYQMSDEAQEDPFLVAGGEHEPTDSDGYDGYETTQPLLPLPVFFSNLEDEDTGGLYMSSVDVPHGSLTNA